MVSADEFRTVDVSTLSVREAYQFMISAIAPRPIALVSTCGLDGSVNAAPFSYFNAVSSRPLCVSLSITAKRDGSEKDTLRNIRETGEMVIHTVTVPLAHAVDVASKEFPYGTSEIEKAGLHMLASTRVRPPRISECPVALESRLYRELSIGDGKPGSSTLLIAEVLVIHVQAQLLDQKDMIIDFGKLDSLSRLGRTFYGRGTQSFSIDSLHQKG